jgi:acyl dehydratase
MGLDPSFIGRSYPPAGVYEVGREKIREFADAIGDAHPAYRDAAAAAELGYPDVIAPPTFAIVVTMAANNRLIADPELGLDFTRVVHGDQRFGYTRPIRAGDRLASTVTVENITSRAGNDFVATRTDVTAEDGSPVVSAWSNLVVRGEGGQS